MKPVILYSLLSLFCLNSSLFAINQAANIPDSILTIDNIYNYTFSDYAKSVTIVQLMRERKMEQPFKLDIAEGDLYFNNGKHHQALKYYTQAFSSDSITLNDERAMKLMHRLISCYDSLHNEEKKAHYIEMLLNKSRAVGDPIMESIARFNMGKMLYNQKDKERGYRLIHEAIELMENSEYEYKQDNLIYEYNSLYILQQRDQNFEKALKTLDRLTIIIAGTTDENFNMEGINRKELKTMYAHRAFVLSKLNRKHEATEAYNKWKQMGNINKKDDYLIISFLMTIGKYDEVIHMNQKLENSLRQNSDTITYHMRTVKRTSGRAYEAKGDYKNAMKCFNELAVLTDSLKTREQKSAALELVTVYETMEKEAEIRQKNISLQMRNLILLSAAILILLFAVILWRSIKYAHTIRKKNLVMVSTITQLMECKEGERKKDNLNTIDEPQTPLDNKALFRKLDNIVISRKLYLNRNITREDLMKFIGVNKNKFGQIMKEEAQTNISGYLNNYRLELAVKLLKENPNIGINKAAEKCAIPNTSTFYRLFKDKYGMTPVEFRDAYK